MRKPAFCISDNIDTDYLCSNCTADQRLCFHFSDTAIPRLLLSKISSCFIASVSVQAGLCQTWSETQITCFVMAGDNFQSILW